MGGINLTGGASMRLYLLRNVRGSAGGTPRRTENGESPETGESTCAVIGVRMHDPGASGMTRRIMPSVRDDLKIASVDSEHLRLNKFTCGAEEGGFSGTTTCKPPQHAAGLLLPIDHTTQPGAYHANSL